MLQLHTSQRNAQVLFSIEKGSNFSWNKILKKVAKIYKRMNAAAMSPQQSCSVKQDV